MDTNEQAISTVAGLKSFLLDLVFPVTCLGCGAYGSDYLCPVCRDKIKLQNGFACAFCRAPVVNGLTCPFCRRDHNLDQLLVAVPYDNPLIKAAIKAFKYHFVRQLGQELAPFLVTLLQRSIRNDVVDLTNTIVVPVPLAQRRLNQRGFNQAELLAATVADNFGLPLLPAVLSRRRYTRPQAEMPNRQQRLDNLRQAFICRQPGVVGGRQILLVDDIATTGSTLEHCAQVLKTAGAHKVIGLVLARN